MTVTRVRLEKRTFSNESSFLFKEYRHDVESILYAFASKFLEGKDLDMVREELKMTELGKSLIEEGKREGEKEGEKKKAIEVAKNAIKKGLDNETISELTGLSINEIEAIRVELG